MFTPAEHLFATGLGAALNLGDGVREVPPTARALAVKTANPIDSCGIILAVHFVVKKERVTRLIDQVIAQGEIVRRRTAQGGSPDVTSTYWYPRVMSIFHLLGSQADPWKAAVAKCPTDNSPGSTDKLLAVLKAVREAVQEGLLEEIEDAAHAGAYQALLAQAQQLIEDGLSVAGGSVAQSVLQEHLWEWCERVGCLPKAQHSAADQLASALYLRGHMTKADLQNVSALSKMGEHCRRNRQPPISPVDVKTAVAKMGDFIAEHPLP